MTGYYRKRLKLPELKLLDDILYYIIDIL